jgi:hypothetical protein
MRPAPQGRAYREQRHYCHITVLVSSEKPLEKVKTKASKEGKIEKTAKAEAPAKTTATKKTTKKAVKTEE